MLMPAAFVCAFFNQACFGQGTGDKSSAPRGVTLGLAFKGGYNPNFWHFSKFEGFPESLRKVKYPSGGSYTLDQGQIRMRDGWLLPFGIGPKLNFNNRVEIGAGGVMAFNQSRSGRLQVGCYCVGSTVTYAEITTSPITFGEYGNASVRVKGPVWLTVEASSYSLWRNLNFRQGYSEYGGDDTLLKQSIGSHRIPLTLLGGFKMCVDCDQGSQIYFGIRGGMGYWENKINPDFNSINYQSRSSSIMFEAFLEGNKVWKTLKH